MGNRIEIENLEEKRREVGIEDVVLREDIRGLAAGDLVKLTWSVGARRTSDDALPSDPEPLPGSAGCPGFAGRVFLRREHASADARLRAGAHRHGLAPVQEAAR